MKMSNVIFPEGLSIKKPFAGAPSWVKGNVSVKVDEFIAFLKENEKSGGWVNLDLKESKAGNLYFELNTYSKKASDSEQKQIEAHNNPEENGLTSKGLNGEEINIEDIPF